MNPVGRLIEWGRWLLREPLHCGSGVNMIARMMLEGAGAGHDGPPGDGGMLRMAEKVGYRLRLSNRCIETQMVIWSMPRELQEVVYATYAGPSARDIPRNGVRAAGMLNIPKERYWKLKAAALDRLECRRKTGT